MNYTSIHQALKAQGFNWRIASEAIGCSPHHLMNVSARRVESRPVAVALATLVKKDVAIVFPDIPRYQIDHKSVRKHRLSVAKAQLASAGLRSA